MAGQVDEARVYRLRKRQELDRGKQKNGRMACGRWSNER
jgi:hypothetical protein